MAELSSNVLSSLVASLNDTVSFANKNSPMYMQELQKSANLLNICYEIPSLLESVTTFQVDTIHHILNNTFSMRNTTGFNKEIDETENKVFSIFREFDRYKNIYSGISNNILEKLSAIQNIHEIIERMKNIAREIKLFSINSVIVASQAGSQGIAFKSISRFIIELSDAIQKSAVEMENYRDKILNTHKKMESLFHKLIHSIYEQKAVEVKQSFLKNVNIVKSRFSFISVIIDNTSQRITKILQESQIIGRQFKAGSASSPLLDYWTNAIGMLGELQGKNLGNDGTEDILTTVAYTYHILNNLSKKMINHDVALRNFIQRISRMYESLVNNFGSIQQDTMYILNYISIRSGRVESLLDRIFEDFEQILDDLKELLEEESTVKKDLEEVFLEMNKIYNEGLGFFANFEKFSTIMNNINVLAQIEMSKKDFDGSGNSNLKSQFVSMLDQLKLFDSELKGSIQKMLMSLTTHMASFSDTQMEQSSFLTDTQSFLGTQTDRLGYLKKEAHNILNSVREENQKIYTAENRARNHLNHLGDQLDAFIKVCTDYSIGTNHYLGRFNGVFNYYGVSIRDYLVNNLFIQNYEKIQARRTS